MSEPGDFSEFFKDLSVRAKAFGEDVDRLLTRASASVQTSLSSAVISWDTDRLEEVRQAAARLEAVMANFNKGTLNNEQQDIQTLISFVKEIVPGEPPIFDDNAP